MAHDCSFLLWINERTASLDSCLLRHKVLAILEGRDHAPEMVLDSPSMMLPALGHLTVWSEKGVTAVLCQVGTRGVTQLLRFACRFSRTKLPSTRVFGLREQSLKSLKSSKQTEGAWRGPSPQAQAVCLLQRATQYYFLCAMMLGGKLEITPQSELLFKNFCSWAWEHPVPQLPSSLAVFSHGV